MKKQDIKEIIESTILIAKCSIEFNKELIKQGADIQLANELTKTYLTAICTPKETKKDIDLSMFRRNINLN
ncbi:hypothetical protein [Clostridium butyricum]|uniref:hypothetical protein n=1 Tax=Clostridium butyricum TaxID=1492 RepID=UPI0006E6B15D|nr:hypothetical protein [Clostridium butyricum]KQB76801.1 hypothetical protein AK964_21150 [Clostridium butyricum]MDB2162304.1 hypothetical protein [Clostridium butyricum]